MWIPSSNVRSSTLVNVNARSHARMQVLRAFIFFYRDCTVWLHSALPRNSGGFPLDVLWCRYLAARGPQERIALLQTEISAHHSLADTVNDCPPTSNSIRSSLGTNASLPHGLRTLLYCSSCTLSGARRIGDSCVPPQVSHTRRVHVHTSAPKNVPLTPASSQIHAEHHHRRHLGLGHVKSNLSLKAKRTAGSNFASPTPHRHAEREDPSHATDSDV